MAIDINQFVQTFLEESFEGLEAMEAQLLALKADDVEAINAIFRAAHSIKGGAGTFGFGAVSDFVHGVETLLDEMRAGRRAVTPGLVSLLLSAVDCIREMLQAAQDDAEIDVSRVAAIGAAIDVALATSDVATAQPEAPASSGGHGWKIDFVPVPGIFATGNDPLRILRALAELGDPSVVCRIDRLPPAAELAPEHCYLSWEILLHGRCEREEIAELFEWVEEQCELRIEPLAEDVADTAAPVDPASDGGSAVLAEAAAADAPGEARTAASSGSIRVNIDKVDALINLVGELVITQSMLDEISDRLEADSGSSRSRGLEQLLEGLTQLERNTRELQESVMSIRMLPISFAFNRFHRLVHDVSARLGKKVRVRLSGEQTEIDKTLMEKIGDPLLHLVRNAIDHGIEMPEARVAAGKKAEGTLHLNAYHKGGSIVIEISDDGAGLNGERILAKAIERGLAAEGQNLSNEQLHELIFSPGFSTAEKVNDISGRGVGMDVVRRNIRSLGGSVELQSRPGLGSTFIIRLPLTLAILDGQLVEVSGERYVIPLISIVESIQVQPDAVKSITDRRQVYRLREEYIPIVYLDSLLGGAPRVVRSLASSLLVVVEADGRKLALVVDDLLGQQQVVIKALETNFRRVEGLSGATILGDGTVALILDISGLAGLEQAAASGSGAAGATAASHAA